MPDFVPVAHQAANRRKTEVRRVRPLNCTLSMQESSFVIYGAPDFLPTTAGSLCQTPHLRHFCPEFGLLTDLLTLTGRKPVSEYGLQMERASENC
ncbi:hypothetical protein GCM10010946_00050 [Undibacterium squillarum]|uniref:Uncharacterized protein n=1 Tax=Undibacterium squillarum TaxID=1131567 RepID=A0ABQ2XPY3_9BURK|nr:hypothetical protein GCM10010946_00050 [Undibacterium squillarum]